MGESPTSLLRLLQLTSPALPVGAYAYSQGLEYAIQAGWVNDESSARDWIGGILEHALTQLDGPVLLRLLSAWEEQDPERVRYWNRFILASRESRELQQEDAHLGQALARLLNDLGMTKAGPFIREQKAAFVTLFSLAVVRWQVSAADALQGYLWSWTENQVAAAIKLVPLGQTAGQRMLLALGERIPRFAGRAAEVGDDDIGQITQGLAMASAWHETQYSRLFRS